MVKIASRYDYGSIAVHGVHFDPKTDKGAVSMTCQADKDGTDINKIISRFDKTGNILDLLGNSRQPVFGDFADVGDYHGMMCKIARVDQSFQALRADVRKRFNNDPQQLISFLADKANLKEAVDLGLIDKSYLPVEPVVPFADHLDRQAPGAPVAPSPALNKAS